MTYTFRPARRENVPLLLGVAGYTGSGKTYSAMLLAKGIAGDKPFAVIDTENGRANHYADDFNFEVADLRAPFRPERYAEAIAAADKAGYPVIVVDSFSHEYAGDGGMLDWAEEELDRLAGDDWKKREAMAAASWIKPKRSHKQMMTRLLQIQAHVILCFRAEEKIEFGKDERGKTVVRPKRTLTGGSLDGWIPITEKTVPYEMTSSFLLSPASPGVPRPIKLEDKHRPFVPLDRPLDESVGRRLAEWAAGSAPGMVRGESQAGAETSSVGEPQAVSSGRQAAAATVSQPDNDDEVASPTDIVALVTALVGASQRPDATAAAIENHAASHPPEQHYAWLLAQAEKKGVVIA